MTPALRVRFFTCLDLSVYPLPPFPHDPLPQAAIGETTHVGVTSR